MKLGIFFLLFHIFYQVKFVFGIKDLEVLKNLIKQGYARFMPTDTFSKFDKQLVA